MIVLGLDPGTRHFGWGVIARQGSRFVHKAHGIVHTDTTTDIAHRLVEIEEALVEVVERHAPTAASVESLFFARDPQAAAKLGHARGVALLVCARVGLPVAEYPPARVKRAVVGGGRAAKDQVAQMVRIMLGLEAPPPADAADALAVALTHLQAAPFLAAAAQAKRAVLPPRTPTNGEAPLPSAPPSAANPARPMQYARALARLKR